MMNLPANSNCHWRHEFYGAKTQECLAEHIPYAQYLIKTYCKEYWKNFPEDLQYIKLEVKLALSLHSLSLTAFQRGIVTMIKVIADDLMVMPLELYNDPNVPLLALNRETDFMRQMRESSESMEEKRKWLADYAANHPNG